MLKYIIFPVIVSGLLYTQYNLRKNIITYDMLKYENSNS